jgi:hypothetical protein
MKKDLVNLSGMEYVVKCGGQKEYYKKMTESIKCHKRI